MNHKTLSNVGISLICIVGSLVFTSCGPGQLLETTFTPLPTETVVPLPTNTATFTPLPTYTPVPTDTPAPTPTESTQYETRPEILAVYQEIEMRVDGLYERIGRGRISLVEDMKYILKDPQNANPNDPATMEATMYKPNGEIYGQAIFIEGKLRLFLKTVVSDDPDLPITILSEMGVFDTDPTLEAVPELNSDYVYYGDRENPKNMVYPLFPSEIKLVSLAPIRSLFENANTPKQYMKNLIRFYAAVSQARLKGYGSDWFYAPPNYEDRFKLVFRQTLVT